MVKKLLFGIACGIFFGAGYANSGCQGRGKLIAYAVFISLGLYYATLSHGLERLLASFGIWVRCLVPPILMPLILLTTIAFITPRDNRVMYAIFQYREPDPIGPGFFTIYFLAFVILSTFVIQVIRSIVVFRASS